MISREQIARAVQVLANNASADRIILFGSYARGEAREDSDLDLLVIEPQVPDKAREMVRLRRALRSLRIPVDVLVFSRAEAERWGDVPGTPLYWALKEGKVLHESRH